MTKLEFRMSNEKTGFPIVIHHSDFVIPSSNLRPQRNSIQKCMNSGWHIQARRPDFRKFFSPLATGGGAGNHFSSPFKSQRRTSLSKPPVASWLPSALTAMVA